MPKLTPKVGYGWDTYYLPIETLGMIVHVATRRILQANHYEIPWIWGQAHLRHILSSPKTHSASE
jgi:hypothetical protein